VRAAPRRYVAERGRGHAGKQNSRRERTCAGRHGGSCRPRGSTDDRVKWRKLSTWWWWRSLSLHRADSDRRWWPVKDFRHLRLLIFWPCHRAALAIQGERQIRSKEIVVVVISDTVMRPGQISICSVQS
jgi:hypothetical protein